MQCSKRDVEIFEKMYKVNSPISGRSDNRTRLINGTGYFPVETAFF